MARSDVITVRIDPDTKRRLEQLSEATDRTQSWIAEAALKAYLKEQEWQVARIREGVEAADRGELVDHDRVVEWMNSWGTDHETEMPEPQ